ncbi:uncharacterized protein G2W53_028795 [Senna tora]|uniref:Uncharacterized protein n=1 Tax=Senna tora TaxID=362788 RepID=A0A834T422_9FABA|nr:uncharacterized protein G2W53_028795 [Senna tora]
MLCAHPFRLSQGRLLGFPVDDAHVTTAVGNFSSDSFEG